MPATNVVSERFTYLSTNMSQSRLNHTMVLQIHKEKTDALTLVNTANEFPQSIHLNNLEGLQLLTCAQSTYQ